MSAVVLAEATAGHGVQAPARMPAAVLAPPSHSEASPPVPWPWHSPDRLSIPETVLEFWRCLQQRPELRELSGCRRAVGSLQAYPRELENSRTCALYRGATTSWERKQSRRGPTCPGHIPTLCPAWAGCCNHSEGGSVPNFMKLTISSGRQEGDECSEGIGVVLEWGLWRHGGHEAGVVWDPG